MIRSRSWDREGKADRLYGRRWRKARAAFLMEKPFCTMCEAEGKLQAATVVDHVKPHRGDEALFWDQGNWQPLCERHHNRDKARLEIRGYSDRLGDDGWPIDPAHPANGGMEPVSGRSQPDEIKPIGVPVLLVVGPPASGKTTWCREQMREGDVLIDFDEIDAQLNGVARRRGRLVVPILRERNKRLLDAAAMKTGRVFLPMTGARSALREWWRGKLGKVTVVLVETDEATCIERIRSSEERSARADDQVQAVTEWFDAADREGVDIIVAGGASQSRQPLGRTRPPPTDKYLVSIEDRKSVV